MKVEEVKQNINPQIKVGRRVKYNHAAQSFTGISQSEKDVMNMLHNKKSMLMMKKFEWLKGEIGGILLTALGTGAVAPIFIAFNPFVRAKKDATPEEKEDLKNTKKYTGMRQPISAALAILFQASVQKYIDKFLDAIFNNPKRAANFRENLDQSYLNTETYIKDNVVRDLKEQGIKKPSLLKSLLSKKVEVDGEKVGLRTQYDMLVNDKVEAIKNQQLKDITDAFKRDNKIYVGGEVTADGVVNLGKRELGSETVADLVNKQINEYKKDASKLIKTEKQINEYLDKADLFIREEGKIRKMFAANPWNEIKATDDPIKLKELYVKTTKMLEDALKNEKNPKIQGILQEILTEPDDLRAYKVQRTLDRIDYIKRMCEKEGGAYSRPTYHRVLTKRNSVLSSIKELLEGCKIKDVSKATEETIGSTISKVAELCNFKNPGNPIREIIKDFDGTIIEAVFKNTDTFGEDTKSLKNKMYEDIAKGYKDLVKNHYKSWNQVSKILVGVFITLPITCTALNWVYPRFMELFFPKLAGVKKNSAEAQQQQVAQAQKVGGDK